MQNSGWVALLKHIPIDQQSRFMLVTASGTEIAIASFLLIEQECVAIKGRLSGSQDAGRVFFIPYRHIDYFGFSQPVKDADFTDLFGNLTLPAQPPSPPPPEIIHQEAEPVVPEPEPEPAISESSTSDSRPVIRSEVLERFRSRMSLPSPVAPSTMVNPQRTQS